MKHTKEEILKALNVIKDECKEAEECICCPFSDKNAGCMFHKEQPYEWDIKSGEEVWRAFWE